MDTENHSKLIDTLGGTAQVAALCEISPAAVSQWRTDGIPKSRLMFLRLAKPEAFGMPTKKKPKSNRTHPTEQQERETESAGGRSASNKEQA